MLNHEGKKKGSHTTVTTPKKSPSPLQCVSSHWINYPWHCLFPFAFLFLGLIGSIQVHSQRHEKAELCYLQWPQRLFKVIRAKAICSEGRIWTNCALLPLQTTALLPWKAQNSLQSLCALTDFEFRVPFPTAPKWFCSLERKWFALPLISDAAWCLQTCYFFLLCSFALGFKAIEENIVHFSHVEVSYWEQNKA